MKAGVSNVGVGQLAELFDVASANGLLAYQVLQPEYNLYNRDGFNGALRDLCIARNIDVVTYYSLASGFLSGKYRSAADLGQSRCGSGIAKYLTPCDEAIVKALDKVAENHEVTIAEVALAWVMARPGVIAPIAAQPAGRTWRASPRRPSFGLARKRWTG